MKKRILLILSAWIVIATIHAQSVIDIVFTNTKATVTIPSSVSGVTSSVSGTNVTITSTTTNKEYTYRVSGTCADGQLVINGNYKLTLVLAGINLTNSHGGAAIDVECGKRIAVQLASGTVNTLADAATGSQKAALYFKGHPEIEGGGTLFVTGRLKHAICAKEYMQLKRTTGQINILGAVSDGIHCGKGKADNEHNYFQMDGGTVNIANVGSDGIDSDDYGVIRINGGALSVNVADGGAGLNADSILTVNDGLVNIEVPGHDADALRADYALQISGGDISIIVSGDGSKGLKSKCQTEATATVKDGGNLTICGGTTSIEILGDTYNDTTGGTSDCVAIFADKTLTQTDGTVDIVAMGLEAIPYKAKEGENLNGGELTITRIPWKIKTRDYAYDMTIYGIVAVDGSLIDDYTDKAIGAFIGDECVGYGVFESNDYGTLRIRSSESGTRKISFQLYDYITGRETALTTDDAVYFAHESVVGTPGYPIVLYTGRFLRGDVNADGMVDISDVLATVSHILSKPEPVFIRQAADVVADDKIDISDVLGIVDIILGKSK